MEGMIPNMNRIILRTLCVAVLLGLCTTVQAAGLGMNFIRGKKIDADPNKTYMLTEKDGPWMILAYTFSGEESFDKANELVLELRQRYKLEAFVFEKTFNFNITEGMRATEKAQIRRKKYSKPATKEYAVLVGNFVSTEDEEFKKALKAVKTAAPEALKKINFNGVVLGNSSQRPMAMAFATPNPVLPKEFFNDSGTVDEFVAKLNANNKYSLLNNKGRYTLRVASFRGNIEIQQDKVEKLTSGRADAESKKELQRAERKMQEAEASAALLCDALRRKGFQAYEFHDRYSSIVTVGAYNDIGTPGPDGMTELHPEIVRLRELFMATPVPVTQPGQLPYKPKTLMSIEFDIEPKIIPVPKKRADYTRR